MDIATARTAGTIAVEIDALMAQLDQMNAALSEMNNNLQWTMPTLRIQSPDQGSTFPAGTQFDLAVGGVDFDTTKLALTTAVQKRQDALTALQAQLAAL